MIGETLAIVKRVVILLLAVVLIAFGGLQLMRGRNHHLAMPRLINLYGVQSPVIPPEPVYLEEPVAEAPPSSWGSSDAIAETRAQPRLPFPEEIEEMIPEASTRQVPAAQIPARKESPAPPRNYDQLTEIEDLLRR